MFITLILRKCFQSIEKWVSEWVDDNSRLWKITKYYRKVREYKKRKLDDMFRQLEVFVCSSRESRTQKSELVNKCKC